MMNNVAVNNMFKQLHGLLGTSGLECTVALVYSCISANLTELNCTLEIQGVD